MPTPSANRIRIELTQYGQGKSVGGWDSYEDDDTNKGLASFGVLVDGETLAITRAIVAFFPFLRPRDMIQIEREDGTVLFAGQYLDHAEWNNPAFTDSKKWAANFKLARIDRFMRHFDPTLPDGLSEPLYASIPARRAGLA